MNYLINLYNKIPVDKKGHVTLGLLLGLALGSHICVAAGAVIAAALGKEVYDYIYNRVTKSKYHEVSVTDALCTIVGGVLGVLMVAVINYLI